MHTFILKSVLYLVVISISSSASEKNDFPDINDIFMSLSEDPKELGNVTKPPGVILRNIDINVENLNMSKFLKQIEGYSKTLRSNTSDGNELVKQYNNTRRLLWIGTWYEWGLASQLLVQSKIYDLMLQLIFMARHKIKQLENDPYYNPGDTSYRIAFLYRNLLRLRRTIMDAWMTMKSKFKQGWPLTHFLVLHHKIAKLHVDFLYLWWVMVRLNERYEYRHGIPNTTPRRGAYRFTRATTPPP